MVDQFCSALWREKEIVVGAAATSGLCASGQSLHRLQDGSALALARLLTATALVRFIQPREGTMSLQVLTKSHLRQVFADVDDVGNLRGYCRGNAVLQDPTAARPSLAPLLGHGVLSVLRARTREEYTHSTVDLLTSEIDEDVVHFAHQSEQIPTVLACDVRLENGAIQAASGFIAQGLPGADLHALDQLRQAVAGDHFRRLCAAHPSSPQAWLQALVPASENAVNQGLRWQCRCSRDRALGALRMLPPDQLQEMVSQNETAAVDCDFCGEVYRVAPEELAALIPAAG